MHDPGGLFSQFEDIFSRLFLKEPSADQAVTDNREEDQAQKQWIPVEPGIQVYE